LSILCEAMDRVIELSDQSVETCRPQLPRERRA
jgi:hypothetical protein